MPYPYASRKKNPAIPFYPSPIDVVRLMLNVAEPKEGQVLVDLGCGDGRVLVEAATNYGSSVVGVESNPWLASYAYNKLLEKGIKNFKIVKGDLFEFNFSSADIITLYLTHDALKILKPRLESYIKPRTKLVAHDFPIPGWRPIAIESIISVEDGKLHKVYLYDADKSFNNVGRQKRYIIQDGEIWRKAGHGIHRVLKIRGYAHEGGEEA
ncbi:MAG: class I SAM-dependent methyltransferase [Nitrososphaerota archaeon]